MFKQLLVLCFIYAALSSPSEASTSQVMGNLIMATPQVLGDVTELTVIGSKQVVKAFQKGRATTHRMFVKPKPSRSSLDPAVLFPAVKK